MARPELGLKRQCMSCGAKFYDLARDPAACPKCGAVYQAATSRVAAPALARGPAEAEDEDDTDEKAPDLVSLDEVEAPEDEADPTPEDDTAEDGDSAADETFLEEEDSGDDVSDLIDGDIESDEES
ncbi:TIGR02300 family protein [Methylobacterium sp. E-066]|uniref:TIGR02300 family protein n=1 Tax=Methylobacterium sp. E-066 TaxID=2836584 RepID=UPI0028C4B96F|nr:TIGR02300 family protein [Methylobacterium sp. E-066]